MKVIRREEVLWLYELGERNFRRQNLRGKSFRGEDLSGVDFSGSDIRGADFTDTILVGANFTNVVAGLAKRQSVILLTILTVLTVLLGILVGLFGAWVEVQLNDNVMGTTVSNHSIGIVLQWVTLLVTFGFCFVSLTKGMTVGFSVFIIAFLVAGATALTSSEAVPIAGGIAMAITVDSLVAVATTMAASTFMAAVLAFPTPIALLVAGCFALAFGSTILAANQLLPTSINASIIVLTMAVMVLSIYLGWRSAQGDRRPTFVWTIAHTLATRWGTSFRRADLTHANFSRAVLKSTDFTAAKTLETWWE